MKSNPLPILAWARVAFFIALAGGLFRFPAKAQWSNGRKANAVIGQPNFTSFINGITSATTVQSVYDVAADTSTGKIFVADFENDRVLRFESRAAMLQGAPAEAVLGQNSMNTGDSGTSAFQFSGPMGVAVDSDGRLWVSDSGNSRVLRFDNASILPNGASADGVLGQPDFVTADLETNSSSLKFPDGIEVDLVGNLWVADTGNNRVLKFTNAAALPNGAAASTVLGQADFNSDNEETDSSSIQKPSDIETRFILISRTPFVFEIEMWVSDSVNNRVLRFDDASNKMNGEAADGVLGQSTFLTKVAATTAAGLNLPRGLALDGSALWVVDAFNRRVLRFEDAPSKPNGGFADFVLGAPEMNILPPPDQKSSQSRFAFPSGAETDDDGNLFVTDTGFNRVLRFSPGFPQPDNTVGKKRKAPRGNNLYPSPAGQKITVKARDGRPRAKVFYTLQNDGPYDDLTKLRASKGNRKIEIQYFLKAEKRKNVSAKIVRGKGVKHLLLYNSTARLDAKIRFLTKAKKNVFFTSQSLENGARDKVKAKVIGNPR